jgi:hypothetical protein
MTTAQLISLKKDPNYVAPVSDYLLGRRMFRGAIPFSDCTTRSMRRGWLDAADAAMESEYEHGGIASMEALAGVLQ